MFFTGWYKNDRFISGYSPWYRMLANCGGLCATKLFERVGKRASRKNRVR